MRTVTVAELAELRKPGRKAKVTVPSADSWDSELLFVVPGPPQAWQRAGQNGTRRFTKPETAAAEALVAYTARAALGGLLPLGGPVDLGCWFFVPDRKRRDTDNLLKLVKDALNGVAWLDDSQVTDLAVIKRLDRERPRTVIRVREASPAAIENWAGTRNRPKP